MTAPKRIPHLRKPDDMSLEAWPVALRRQFAQEQKFRVKNIGVENATPEAAPAAPEAAQAPAKAGG